MSTLKKGKKRRSLPSLLNPFSLFGSSGSSSKNGMPRVTEEKALETSGDIDTKQSSTLPFHLQIQYLSAHSTSVEKLCKVDDHRFASASLDGLLLIWSTDNGLLLDVLMGHSASISSLFIVDCESRKLLISASLDHSVRVWDVTDCSKQSECITILRDHESPIIQMMAIDDGKGLITASKDTRIGIWRVNSKFVSPADDQGSDDQNGGDGDESHSFYRLDRFIEIEANLVISEMIFLSTPTARHLIMGCTMGTMVLIDFNKKDRIKLIQKHFSKITALYQSSVDRFISASFDGLICVWRIEAQCPQLLERINDTTNHIPSPSVKTMENQKCPQDLRFLVKCIVKNIYDGHSDIVAMATFGEIKKLVLITVSGKHVVKCWNLSGIQLHTIRTGLWFSCFRQELMSKMEKSHRGKQSSNMASNLCIDPQRILLGRFQVHSADIASVVALSTHCFVTCDAANQIVLWKDAYVVSFQQNRAIQEHFNYPSST